MGGVEQTLELRLAGTDERRRFTVRSLVVAGFTGRDSARLESHIEELARHGVPRPERVPDFYLLPPTLLTAECEVAVEGGRTSGEAEAVLLCADHGRYVAIGSDHTDRELERTSIVESKRRCPKPLGREILPFDRVAATWDRCALRSWLDDGTPYQDAELSQLLPPGAVLGKLRETVGEQPGDVAVFLGTVPLLESELRPSSGYSLELAPQDGGAAIGFSYRVKVGQGAAGSRPAAPRP